MDADAMDLSNLCVVYQPLDVLRLELQKEPAFAESTMPKDDHTLTRFLKARGYNASQAKQMVLDCIQWRRTVEDIGIEELYRRTDPFDFPGRDEIFESWPMGFHKTDKLGRPVHIQSFGAISYKRLYGHITPQEHWRTVLVNIEALLAEVLPAASLAAGRPIRQALVIVDLKGFGLSQFWAFKSIARRFFDVSQNYFPETMGQLIIINAPTSFTAIWSMIKPWLAPRTLDKITILGTNNPEQHAARLLDLVPSENLPAALGGTCSCTCTYGASVTTSSSSSSSSRGDDESSDSSRSGDSDGESGGGGGGGGGGCVLSNAGPWMEGRAERRTRWLRGEISSPGVSWPPPSPPPPPPPRQNAQVPESARGAGGAGTEEATREESEVVVVVVGASQTQTAAAPPSSAGASSSSSSSSSSASMPSPSCGRASVVGLPLPLPLPHQPPPAAVPLVV